ncbi:hypothetical protein BBJ28_00010184 [Nothophytophthora sp. Chile5]|nr:hypothetical protein BBJ28_00010184 [Nothophytophthora sp. Chile5]
MKVLCDASPSGRPLKAETIRVKEELTRFYTEHYELIILDTLNYRHLNTVLDYMAIDGITMHENNIKHHYCQYVERFVNMSLQKRERIEATKATEVSAEQKKAQTNLLCRELRKVKNDILSVNDPNTSDPQYHKWVNEQRPQVMPQLVLRGNSVFYDIPCTPQGYLTDMVYMMEVIETAGNAISSVFPLRTEKKLVGIDSNMGDRLYCVNSDQREQTMSSYSQDTRRKETNFKKYRDLLQSMSRDVVDGRRAIEWEAGMSAYNSNTLNFEAFKVYLQHKYAQNMRLAPLYNKYLFRKLRLSRYSRWQITEVRLRKRFELLLGSSEQAVVYTGDWEQKQNRKLKDPVNGKGFRTLFLTAGCQMPLGSSAPPVMENYTLGDVLICKANRGKLLEVMHLVDTLHADVNYRNQVRSLPFRLCLL